MIAPLMYPTAAVGRNAITSDTACTSPIRRIWNDLPNPTALPNGAELRIGSTRPDLLCGARAAALIAAGDDHRRALLGHRQCGGATHPGCATGDQSPVVFQIHRRHLFGSWNTQSTLADADPSRS